MYAIMAFSSVAAKNLPGLLECVSIRGDMNMQMEHAPGVSTKSPCDVLWRRRNKLLLHPRLILAAHIGEPPRVEDPWVFIVVFVMMGRYGRCDDKRVRGKVCAIGEGDWFEDLARDRVWQQRIVRTFAVEEMQYTPSVLV